MAEWSEYERMVIHRLDSLEGKVDKLVTDVAGLKVKAGIWGLIGGAIPVVIGVAYIILRS